ncbi:MAG TPA: hypothetical protein VLQ91_14350 [Draconibacterium sp.]|nr:hypothetical protein [Draconibacterium sp.]
MIQRLHIILFLLIAGVVSVQSQVKSGSYLQDIKTEIHLPENAGKNVIKLFSTNQSVTAVTSNGVFCYRNSIWSGQPSGSNWQTATMDKQGKVWLATTNFIQQENLKEKITLPELSKSDTILCLFWEDEKTLHVGTTGGLLTWNGKWNILSEIKARVNSVTMDAQKQLWVATTGGLWRRSASKWVNMDETMMDPGNGRTYFALQQQKGGAEILLSTPYSVGCISETGNHWVLRAADGLPYGPVKVIEPADGCLWFGTEKGAIKKDSGWHYYNGKRWLPDNKVNDILPIDSRTVWIATPNGISQIQQVEMTLEQKADSIGKIAELRHNRLGLINHSKLKIPGDLSSSYVENEDNDGLWTACYLAAQCFRYGATKSDDAREIAVRTFEALERLETVTGISGYPARSYALATDSVKQSRSPHPKHWHPSPDGRWQWIDDTSSDEIAGHIFSIALFYELVADENQKEKAKNLIERIMNHIVDNNFRMIDFDGLPTRWGIWNPDSLNHSKNWMFERGLNSLQILSHLKTATQITGNPKFEKAYNELVEKHGYAQNAVQAKIYGPFETSHSDDILNFFPYYILIRYSADDKNLPLYIQSLERTWKAVRTDRMPVWNVMASALLKKDRDLQVVRAELEQYPLDLINWTMENSHRWDLQHDMMAGRFNANQATKPIPTPESNVSRWNTNPRQLNSGLNGTQEEDGSYFLFAYWMGRYYGFFNE